jgi:hypothetical protein
LEQRCVAPGHWVIEGWDVRITPQRDWRATRFGEQFRARTLADVKDEIRQRGGS